MLKYLVRRVLLMIPVGLGVTIICFMLVQLAPGDPLTAVMPIDATAAQQAELRTLYGFDQPLPVQYGRWLWRAAHGDLGTSIATGRPVSSEVSRAVGNSIILAAVATAIGFTFGILFGFVAGYFPGGVLDRLASMTAVLGVSVPHYWLGMVMVIVFSSILGWLPATGAGPDGSGNWRPDLEHLRYLILPAVTMSVIPMGIIARTVRALVSDLLGQEFVRRPARQGPAGARRLQARRPQRRPDRALRDGPPARLPARRLHPDRDGVRLARHRLPPQRRHLPARRPAPPGHDPRAGQLLRAHQLRRRPAADRARSADPARMSATTAGTAPAPVLVKRTGYWGGVLQRLARDKVAMAALAVILLIVLAAIFAPWVAPADPLRGSMLRRLRPPGTPGYPLGADELGRDMLSRLIWGGRLSLFIGLTPVAVAFVAGSVIGVAAGYVGGWFNTIAMRTIDIFFAFPSVLLAIALSGALGAGIFNSIVSLVVVFTPQIARVAESVTTQIRTRDYVEAARISGAGSWTVVRVHILGNVLGPIFVYSTSLISVSMILASGLSFLGLGVRPPEPEWGLMLNTLRTAIYSQPLLAALPGAAIFVTSISFNLFSDGLRSAMDVRR